MLQECSTTDRQDSRLQLWTVSDSTSAVKNTGGPGMQFTCVKGGGVMHVPPHFLLRLRHHITFPGVSST